MKTLTVKVSDTKHAKLLYELLSSISFVKEVEIEDDISDEEIQLLEERLVEYNKNPASGATLDTVVKRINKKHGFKNNR